MGTEVTDRKTLARRPAAAHATGRTYRQVLPINRVSLERNGSTSLRRNDNQLAAGHALADIVIGIGLPIQCSGSGIHTRASDPRYP